MSIFCHSIMEHHTAFTSQHGPKQMLLALQLAVSHLRTTLFETSDGHYIVTTAHVPAYHHPINTPMTLLYHISIFVLKQLATTAAVWSTTARTIVQFIITTCSVRSACKIFRPQKLSIFLAILTGLFYLTLLAEAAHVLS